MIPPREMAELRVALKAIGMPKIALASAGAGAVAFGVLIWFLPFDVAAYAFCMITLLPASAAHVLTASHHREINAKAPELFYDLSEYVRASGSLTQALKRAAAGSYGPLSDEVCRVLSEVEDEGYDLATALKAMAARANNASITRAVAVINEALTSSPDAGGVLKMVSAEGRLAQALEAERRSGISSAVLVIYLTALVFLVVVSLCICSFVPVAGQLKSLTSGLPAVPESTAAAAMPYYVLSLSVALCSGLTIGAMRDNSIFGGLKDSAMLVTAAFLVYECIVFPGFDVMGALGL